MEKFITSHGARVKKAKKAIKSRPERISVFDREAFVEFYLLEDIVRLYEYRFAEENKKKIQTRAGEKAKYLNLEKFSAIINIFKSATEIAWGQITSGNYKAVWGAINEHALMLAVGSIKNLPELRKLAVKLLKELSDEALNATKQGIGFDEDLDDLDSHERNVREYNGLPSADDIAEVIRVAEATIPDKSSKIKPLV